jgi:hypothetical protein
MEREIKFHVHEGVVYIYYLEFYNPLFPNYIFISKSDNYITDEIGAFCGGRLMASG